jgi:hypothetical protein
VGIVHRDLKPANVLLAGDGPRVIDFGISRAADASVLTETGMIMGSPGYFSPEQAEGHSVGPPGDVFSLGAVLAFAAAGQNPFGDGPAAAVAFRVVNAEPNLGGVPAQLRPMIERCLAKDPAARPAPAELLASLAAGNTESHWPSQPMSAGTEPFGGQARPGPPPAETKPARLGLITSAAAVLAAAATVIALIVSGHGSGAVRAPTASPGPSAPGKPTVDGVWTGTYDCDQGPTGMQLTITGSTGGALRAIMRFYPIAANPGVADGSYELVGSYSAAAGLVLNPDYWIDQPAGYEMIGLDVPRPRANSMTGSIHVSGCSTFSVSR